MVRGIFTRFLIYCTFSQVVECISLDFTAEEVILSCLLSGAGSIPPPNHVHTFRSSVNIISYICNGCIHSIHYPSLPHADTQDKSETYIVFLCQSLSHFLSLSSPSMADQHMREYTCSETHILCTTQPHKRRKSKSQIGLTLANTSVN